MRRLLIPALLLLLSSMCAFGDLAFSVANTPLSTVPGGTFDPTCQSVSGLCALYFGEVDPDPATDYFVTSVDIAFISPANASTFLAGNEVYFDFFGPAFMPAVANGGTPYNGGLFEIDVDPSTPFGVYTGTATFNYGLDSDPADSNLSQTVNWELDVAPEPGTIGLAAIALGLFAWRTRVRRPI